MILASNEVSRITTKHGVELGTIEPGTENEGWLVAQFTPSLSFNAIESLFYHRNEAIEDQLFTHEDMMHDAVDALGISVDGSKIEDLFIWPDGRMTYRLQDHARTQKESEQRNGQHKLKIAKQSA